MICVVGWVGVFNLKFKRWNDSKILEALESLVGIVIRLEDENG